jgi:hypothetical protein
MLLDGSHICCGDAVEFVDTLGRRDGEIRTAGGREGVGAVYGREIVIGSIAAQGDMDILDAAGAVGFPDDRAADLDS